MFHCSSIVVVVVAVKTTQCRRDIDTTHNTTCSISIAVAVRLTACSIAPVVVLTAVHL